LEQSKQPIRTGEPGKRPFWNRREARRYIFAPAFDFPSVTGACAYRFTLVCEDGDTHVFTANQPWAPLTPVWDKIPEGGLKITVEGVDASGRSVGAPAELEIYRSPVFSGSYHEPLPISYAEAANNGLRAIFLQSKLQHWLLKGTPDPKFSLYCYAAKEMGAVIRGMVAYSKIAEDPEEAANALKIARATADFLIGISIPEGSALEHFPPVYWVNPDPDSALPPFDFEEYKTHRRKAEEGQIHMIPNSVTLAGFGYMDLYDATGESKYLDAARRIARTFANTQLNGGTWPLLTMVDTAEANGPNLTIPTAILIFLDRLKEKYGIAEFDATARKAEQWLFEHSVQTFNWEAQFEDIKPKEPYENLGFEKATEMAYYLLAHPDAEGERIRLAEQLLLFVEDQFIVWEKPRQSWKQVVGDKFPQRTIDHWITPGVIEQYISNQMVTRASTWVMIAYLEAYKATDKSIYLEKARALANGLVVCQQHHGGGEIPTYPQTIKNILWLNNSMYNSLSLLEVSKISKGNLSSGRG
jgi:maltose/maltodextrin transport system substrate-binding protein